MDGITTYDAVLDNYLYEYFKHRVTACYGSRQEGNTREPAFTAVAVCKCKTRCPVVLCAVRGKVCVQVPGCARVPPLRVIFKINACATRQLCTAFPRTVHGRKARFALMHALSGGKHGQDTLGFL